MGEIRALTGLRFVAALYVFLFHIHLHWPLASGFLGNVLSQGAIGMTIFFMLSGYVLAHVYGARQFSLAEYAINRLARIYPVYVVAALVTLPWFGAKDLPQGVLLALANVLMLQAWFPQMFNYWNVGASWSLSAEASFYALFPFLVRPIRGLDRPKLVLLIAIVYALAAIPGLVQTAFPAPHAIYYTLPIFRLAEFVLGMCAYFLSRKTSAPLGLAAIVATIGGVIYLGTVGYQIPVYVTHNWVVVPAVFLGLMRLGRSDGLAARLLGSAPMEWAGRISYSFYSLQPLILMSMLSYKSEMRIGHTALLALAFAALLITSAVVYYVIEHPLRAFIRSRSASDRISTSLT